MEDRDVILLPRESGTRAVTVMRGEAVTGADADEININITRLMDPSDRAIVVPRHGSRLGDHPEANLPVPHPLISARHALLTPPAVPGGSLGVRDLGSAHGTWVDNRRLGENEEIQVPPGATIYLGPVPVRWDGAMMHVPTTPRPPILEARHLKVRAPGRGGRLLLDDVSLGVQPGEFMAIVGPSGAGKSTLLRALCGRVPLEDGHVIVGDHTVTSGPDAASWGYVPQDDTLHTGLSVHRALGYIARLRLPSDMTRQQRKERVEAVLRDVDMQEQSSQQIKTLSGGQRKRVGIACELLVNPAILFLDEPTSGLDPHLDAAIMRLLRRLADKGHTVVLVTHSIAHLDMVDMLAFVGGGGRLIYYGPPSEALSFFTVASYADIYEQYGDPERAKAGRSHFRDSDLGHRYIDERLRVHDGTASATDASTRTSRADATPDDGQATVRDVEDGSPANADDGAAAQRARRRDAIHQMGVLALRYTEVHLWHDKGNLRLILVGTFAVAILLRWISVEHTFTPTQLFPTEQLLTMLALAVTFFGTMLAVHELVKERALYLHERASGLQVAPYILSKTVVLGMLCTLQAGVLLKIVAQKAPDMPAHGILIGAQSEIFVTLTLTAWGAVAGALLLSSLVDTKEQSMVAASVFLLVQLLLDGVTAGLAGAPDWLSRLLVARWSLGALGLTVNLDGLQAATSQPADGWPKVIYSPPDALHLAWYWIILLGLTAAALWATYRIELSRDATGGGLTARAAWNTIRVLYRDIAGRTMPWLRRQKG